MRTLKISLLVFILSISVSAQWYQQTSPNGITLYAVNFVDANNGWAVGQPAYQGTIIKTTDGGNNWILQQNNSGSGILTGVKFLDVNNGWIIGQAGKILRTTNGGQSWVNHSINTGADLRDIAFIDVNTGWVVGSYGVIFKSTDGGQNWISQFITVGNDLIGVSFIDSMTGWAVGGWGTILKTTNGGQEWNLLSTSEFRSYYDVTFINENIGWIIGDLGEIRKTTDGGQTWVTQSLIPNVDFLGISFIDLNKGWVVGSQGRILSTTNGGQVWLEQTSGTNRWLRDVCFTDPLTGTIVGSEGTILRTINGGIPVELISFTADFFESKVELNWSTATEINNQGFEILRSTQNDKREWENIGFVSGHGTTTETQHYSFTDSDVSLGKYQYKLKQIDYDGMFEYSQIVEVEIPFVNKFSLSQNYPNPFNPSTKIKYSIPTSPFNPSPYQGEGNRERFLVTLKVYDILGKEVATLVNEEKPAGEYEVEFNGSDLPSGIYFYQLKVGQYSETKKMILMK